MSITFQGEEPSTNVIGDVVPLIIGRKDTAVTESVINLSLNAVFKIESIPDEIAELANLYVHENELIIECDQSSHYR